MVSSSQVVLEKETFPSSKKAARNQLLTLRSGKQGTFLLTPAHLRRSQNDKKLTETETGSVLEDTLEKLNQTNPELSSL